MKPYRSLFKTAAGLAQQIDNYFTFIQGAYHFEKKPAKTSKTATGITEHKIWDREPEPPTFCGLAFFLGFNSMKEFEAYELGSKFAHILKRGRLRIETIYESRLHQTPTGAMFALKSMGWHEKDANQAAGNDTENTLKVEIINSGPAPAATEKEVIL